MKRQKGITLIALVITIIVLLILAAVSITALTDEDKGVVTKAKQAASKTEGASDEEDSDIQEMMDYIENETKVSLIRQITEENYGDYVNYKVDLGITSAGKALADGEVPKTDWRIFYEDGENVYLIASDLLPASKFPSGVFDAKDGQYNGYWAQDSADTTKLTTSGTVTNNTKFLFNKLSNVTKDNLNYQAVSTLLDTAKWKGFAKEGYVDNVETAVIGSPTVEMWMASWNDKYDDTLAFDANTTGYQVGLTAESLSDSISVADMKAKEGFSNTLYYPHVYTSSTQYSSVFYWLASPSSDVSSQYVLRVNYTGGVGGVPYSWGCGVRPVVCLKSGITAEQDANGVWQLY